MANLSPRLLGAALIVIAASCFGTLGPLAHYADAAGVSSFALVTWRAGVGAICVFIFLGARTLAGHQAVKPWRSLPTRDRRFISAAAVTNGLLNLAAFTAFVRIGIALALLIFYIYPAFVALASAAWFNDRLDRVRVAALGLSLAGMLAVVLGAGPLGDLDLLGIGLALSAALAQTFYALAARHGFGAIPGGQAAALTMGGATLVYLALALPTGQLATFAQPLASFAALWPVMIAGVIGAGVATVCFIGGIRLLGAPRATILSTLEPVVGVGLAALLFGDQPSALQLVGGAAIIGAGVLLQLRGHGEVAEHEAIGEAEMAG
jgi:drug/metabolite transporter (DMT)-like permease